MKPAPMLISPSTPLPNDYKPILEEVCNGKLLEKNTARFYKKMARAALFDGVKLKLLSGYRSCEYQKKLFEESLDCRLALGMSFHDAYLDTSMNVAIPGASEHNAGLAADITRECDDDVSESFDKTVEFEWLMANCMKYGFIMRYPANKQHITRYIYEPWHYRYVGKAHAQAIMQKRICLEEYIEFFRFYCSP